MRIERWYWLPVFCAISALLHLGIAKATWQTGIGSSVASSPGIDVTLEPPPPVKKPVPKPEPKKVPEPKHVPPPPSVARGPHRPLLATYGPHVVRPAFPIVVTPHPQSLRATAPRPSPAVPKPAGVKTAELPATVASEQPPLAKPVHDSIPVPIIKRDAHPIVEGGGSPSPAPIIGGHGGLTAPESPNEVVIYDHGGAGRPHIVGDPTAGGGGGRTSVLHNPQFNPLGTEPNEAPSIGPGTNAGIGSGSRGGIGSRVGAGVGVRPDGIAAIAGRSHRPGPGIGDATGSGTGTRPPGGGRGNGSELPGTGGSGNGYGRGHGAGIGNGNDDAGPPIARTRGVPFGNIAGMLGGGPGVRSPGNPGRGAVFSAAPVGGGSGTVHVVYALDISGSMRDGNKIRKAKEALKKAISDLRVGDTFNIIVFKHDANTFRDDSVPATPANKANAGAFVDEVKIGDGTNIQAAMDLAFGMNGITQIYLMSDGEPNGGIGDFNELRRYIRDRNSRNVRISTLALGLGENFPGMILLKGIADDNNGSFGYVNMTRIAAP